MVEQLPLMKEPRDDHVAGFIETKDDQVSRAPNGDHCSYFLAEVEVVREVTRSDVFYRSHTRSGWVAGEIAKRLVDQTPVSASGLCAELLFAPAKGVRDVPLGRT